MKHLELGTLVLIKNHSAKTNGLLGYVDSRDGDDYYIKTVKNPHLIHCYLCELEIAIGEHTRYEP